ncbi:hypothetical protein K1719_045247 [Acacia pycnantha]|nr:hypothetical protein K1719_045247 [Acacia pycnantha]
MRRKLMGRETGSVLISDSLVAHIPDISGGLSFLSHLRFQSALMKMIEDSGDSWKTTNVGSVFILRSAMQIVCFLETTATRLPQRQQQTWLDLGFQVFWFWVLFQVPSICKLSRSIVSRTTIVKFWVCGFVFGDGGGHMKEEATISTFCRNGDRVEAGVDGVASAKNAFPSVRDAIIISEGLYSLLDLDIALPVP